MLENGGKRPRVLIVDDDRELLALTSRILQSTYDVETAESSGAALAIVRHQPVEAVIIDFSLNDGTTGIDLIAEMRSIDSTMVVLMLSGTIEVPDCVLAMRLGASDVLIKPPDFGHLEASLASHLPRVMTQRRLLAQSSLVNDPFGLFDPSPPMQAVVNRVLRLAPIDVPILFRGEPGTGKHALVQVAHQLSARRGEPLLVFAADALAKAPVLEASRRQVMRARPDAVTVLVRDAGRASVEVAEFIESLLQTSCRVLLTEESGPASSNDCAILPARLWQRLSPFALSVPPLRERGEAAFDARVAFAIGRLRFVDGSGPLTMTPGARRKLYALPWHGNVPELQGIITEAFVLAGDESAIEEEHVSAALGSRGFHDVSTADDQVLQDARWTLRAAEYRQIQAVLGHTDGHITQSAKLLGITRSTLYRKMREYGIGDPHEEAQAQ